MLTSDFDYDLPASSIAQEPAPRGESRLLVLDRTGPERHARVRDLPRLLRPGDLLVLNDTRVIPARLYGKSAGDGKMEILLIEKVGEREWDALVKPGRRARPGAVAAPTAGLHFTEELLREIEAAGTEIARVTLHVGIGTFKPVSAERIEEHRMERERYEIGEETAEAIRRARAAGRRIVAVGTTVVRTLEGAALAGGGEVRAGSGATDLFIYPDSPDSPGFQFQVVDVLLTNFHLPRSTLLMLVSAFAGRERVLSAYEEAVREGYRFYSYGDAMLLERAIRLASTAAP